ncbi:transposable element Tcb1 transposase [Trichonephila clavipes]|nr:transposable element Tcb1 transposase [Trichonephila clavipes]
MKIKAKQVWIAPPDHPGISRKSPGGALEFDGNRNDQTAVSRLLSWHLKSMTFESGRKVFQTCSKCHLLSASPEHILDCLGLALEDVHASPLLELDFALLGEIGSRVGRNQTTVMRICDRWMQEGTTDQRGRWHPPQYTTSREDRQIVHMAVTDRSVTSRTVARPIESVMYYSVSARTIRRRLQQSGLSARRPLIGLPLTQNQWCDERRMWVTEWNEVVFTDDLRICLKHQDGLIRVWKHSG